MSTQPPPDAIPQVADSAGAPNSSMPDDHDALVAECLNVPPTPPPDPASVLRYDPPPSALVLGAYPHPATTSERMGMSLHQRRAILEAVEVVADALNFAAQQGRVVDEQRLSEVEDSLLTVARQLADAELLTADVTARLPADQRRAFDTLQVTERRRQADIDRQRLRPLNFGDGQTLDAAEGYATAVAAAEAAGAELHSMVTQLVSDRERAAMFALTIGRGVRSLLDVGEPLSPSPQDGAEGDCWVRVRGVRKQVPRGVVFRLIKHFLDRDFAHYDDLEGDEAVFRDGSPTPGHVRSRCSAANKALHQIGVQWHLRANSTDRVVTKHLGPMPTNRSRTRNNGNDRKLTD